MTGRPRRGILTSRRRCDVEWEPAEPTEATKPLEAAKAWKPDEPAEASPVPSAVAPDPTSLTQTKNFPDASDNGEAVQDYLKENALTESTRELPCGDRYSKLDSNCCLKEVSKGRLVVTVVRAWGLLGDYQWIAGDTEAYAVVTYGSYSHQTNVITSNNPVWNAIFDMGPFDKDLRLTVEVWDQDFMGYNEKLTYCTFILEQGTHERRCIYSGGWGFYFLYTLTCDPYLTGDQCEKYKPSTPTVHSIPLYSKSKHLFSIQSSALLYLWLFSISV